jgi:CDP-glycerol glycerophosphotransferase (TagB/SpsB family)
MHQKTYFEKLSPGLFYSDRAFFPIGSPKTDSLTNNKFSRDELLARLGLANRFTIVITSHWSKYSTLSIFTESIFRRLAEHFPDFNIIQTGHPWLWTENKNTNFNDCMKLKSKLQNIANEYDNAYFIPGLTAEELFPVCDMLVADHSSVITMFSLLDRPIVFFNNLEARANKVGKSEIIDLYINASETFSELDGLVQACVQSKEMHEKKKIGRQRLRDAFFVNIGNSSEVAAEVLSRIGGVYSPKSDRWPSIIEFSNAMCKKYS